MNGLTRDAFESTRTTLVCRQCGHCGLVPYRPANGDLVGAQCPACESKAPLDGVQWLPKDGAAKRRPKDGVDLLEVWQLNGDHCTFCGAPRRLLEHLHIGLTKQHVHPYTAGGGNGPLVPFCARCQEGSVAALKRTANERDALDAFDTLNAIIKRIEAKHPELLG